MDNLDDPENTVKISDSAYSNSCSNSQSRRSHSSKSTHSGSNSSGSSGYGGKLSTSGSSNNFGKEKEAKKKKQPLLETVVTDVKVETEVRPPEPVSDFDAPKDEPYAVIPASPPLHLQSDERVECMEVELSTPDRNSIKNEVAAVFNLSQYNLLESTTANYVASRSTASVCSDGFSCVISMSDGVVMYTTSSFTTILGFPKDMWIGRSFIDFIHPMDRSTFASQITSSLAIPKFVDGTQITAPSPTNSISNMVCRIRSYKRLTSGFGVKDRTVTYVPFLLKLTFKDVKDEEGKVMYLVIQATPFFSAFKTPHEVLTKAAPFVIRHAANAYIEYVDPGSVPYLGFLPQDLVETDALLLYHPDDFNYMNQVYKIIVKEGGLPRSKAYRMMTQNGDYVKLETEWSSFINPWSKKLEFVIGKHHLIEGPANPDVFQTPKSDKITKISEEDKNKALVFRDSIIRIMNEIPTKPEELAKQQMSKRCQDLASFMESLMEEQPKTDEELRLEIQDPDNSYYERDSVMLGGISPHHDFNDSKTSTETPLTYNQLNYNETLQRYFDSHQPYSSEDCNTVAGENILGLKDARPVMNYCTSPIGQNSDDSVAITSSSGSNLTPISIPPVLSEDLQTVALTESSLTKHNTDMEKELLKIHRGNRTSTKGEREKKETRRKKKEHLARCNASYQPTAAGAATTENRPHGIKRPFVNTENTAHKHHCTSPRQSRRMRQRTTSTSVAVGQPTFNTAVAASPWPITSVNNMNTFILGVGLPQQVSFMSPVPAVPAGLYPMYYTPAATAIPTSANTKPTTSSNSTTAFQPPTMQCKMYSQPMYGPPVLYSPMPPQVAYPFQQPLMGQSMLYTESMNPLGLANRNYVEACKPNLSLRPDLEGGTWRDMKRPNSKATCSSTDLESGDNSSSMRALDRSTEAVPDTPRSGHIHDGKRNRYGNSEETLDKTGDDESSYSSFYSSFFKTESGEDSGDTKIDGKDKRMRSPIHCSSTYYEPKQVKKVAIRKAVPPWIEQVCVTSELIYKYQIVTKSIEEVLSADKQKLRSFEQPSLVNDQLGQLYSDMQLEGVAARLTLEEGITSSSSSGEETYTKSSKVTRRKREYSKLLMIYEEDAPMPPGEGELEPEPSTSTSMV